MIPLVRHLIHKLDKWCDAYLADWQARAHLKTLVTVLDYENESTYVTNGTALAEEWSPEATAELGRLLAEDGYVLRRNVPEDGA